MAHWIIEDHGFGGQDYKCSNCGESWNDLFNRVSHWDNCPECNEKINADENEYIEINKRNKSDKEDVKICAAKNAELSRQWLLNVLTEDGLIGVYNLGLEHMYEYLKGEKTMDRAFDICDICKLDKAGICDYECIKTRSDKIYGFHTCPKYIYNDGSPMTNAELLSTDLKTDLELAATQLWYKLAMDDGFYSLEEFVEWLKNEAVID